MIKSHSTNPAVTVVTYSAGHMHAAFIFLNWTFALGTFMSSNFESPFLIHLLLGLLTRLFLVPSDHAFVAKVLVTDQASNLSCSFGLIVDSFTIRKGTEALIV